VTSGTLLEALVLFLGVLIAFANGSNDVSKGVATLAGSGVCDLRRAVRWGVIWTGLGSLASASVAHAMLKAFGRGLFAPGVTPSLIAALATIGGATLWVALSSWRGWPVSTTHAIIGALAGVGVLAYGPQGMRWGEIGTTLLLPLLLSPIAALMLTVIGIRFWSALSPGTADCLCVAAAAPMAMAMAGTMTSTLEMSTAPALRIEACNATQSPITPPGLRLSINHLHWLTSAGASFARGLNDSPKMVAILLAAAAIGAVSAPVHTPFVLAIAAGIVLGSLIAGRKVTRLLAHGITQMSHREGFVANFVTAGLVGPGAALGLPMSTTHVATGAIMGLALGQGKSVDRRAVAHILLAWVVTLPFAAALGMIVFVLLRGAAPHLPAIWMAGAR